MNSNTSSYFASELLNETAEEPQPASSEGLRTAGMVLTPRALETRLAAFVLDQVDNHEFIVASDIPKLMDGAAKIGQYNLINESTKLELFPDGRTRPSRKVEVLRGNGTRTEEYEAMRRAMRTTLEKNKDITPDLPKEVILAHEGDKDGYVQKATASATRAFMQLDTDREDFKRIQKSKIEQLMFEQHGQPHHANGEALLQVEMEVYDRNAVVKARNILRRGSEAGKEIEAKVKELGLNGSQVLAASLKVAGKPDAKLGILAKGPQP